MILAYRVENLTSIKWIVYNTTVTWCMIGGVGRGSSKGICWVSCMLRHQLSPLSQWGCMIPPSKAWSGLGNLTRCMIPAFPSPHVVAAGGSSSGACTTTPTPRWASIWRTLYSTENCTSRSESASTSLQQGLERRGQGQGISTMQKPGRDLLWVELEAGVPEMMEQGH